jgi:hypothetical protein
MSVIDRVVVDFAKTFSGPGLFLGVEPKMERADKNDPNSQEVQARDKNNGGALKWTATVAVKYKAFSKDKSEVLSFTLVSPTQPCSDVPLGQTVMIEGLEMGIMRQDRGGFSQFWSAVAVRPVRVQAPQGQAAPAVSR